jgi:hypothetical protein
MDEAVGIIDQDDVISFQHRQEHLLEVPLPQLPFVESGFDRIAGSEVGKGTSR